MVPGAGIEPARPFGQRILSPCSVILHNTYISYISLFKGFQSILVIIDYRDYYQIFLKLRKSCANVMQN